jgi:tetratricopeptide (TPR) repeat protein
MVSMPSTSEKIVSPNVNTPARQRRQAAAPHNARGLALYQQGDRAGALACFEAALALDPTYPEAHNNRGMTRQGLGDLPGALADFDRALQLRPHYVEALNNRALARQQAGELAGALADLDTALELTPLADTALLYHHRGLVRQQMGDLAGARGDFDQVLDIMPGHGMTWARRGLVRKAQGDLAGALADLTEAIARSPRECAAPLLHDRGGVRVLLGDLAGALLDYNEVLRLDPKCCLAWVSRGNARFHRRDPEAHHDYAQAFRLDAGRTARELARLIVGDARADATAALRNCHKHLRLDAADPIALARLGLTLLALHHDQPAQPSLARVGELLPGLRPMVDKIALEVLRQRGSRS